MIVINFFGGPGSGKSTTSSALFSMMKMVGMNCELVTEYAKDLTWSENFKALAYQPYVMANQSWRIERLNGLVDYVITDSPILLSSFYSDPSLPQCFHDFVLWEHNKHTSINFFMRRTKPYTTVGRNQTEEEAEVISNTILNKLQELDIHFTNILAGDGTAAISAFTSIIALTNQEIVVDRR